MKRSLATFLTAAAVVAGGACSSPTGPDTIVTSVQPAGGSVNVDPGGPVEVVFSRPMRNGMEAYAVLHLGDASGPAVPGAWSWSDDQTTLTFTPADPLESGRSYTVHLGGGMMDADGRAVEYQHCADQHNGEWATSGMMGNNTGMMGPGWRHANGSYGMVFTFTTG